MGFLGKHRIARRERRQQMLVMQMIGRTDHHQVERAVFQQRIRTCISAARFNPVLFQNRQADRRGIGITGKCEIPADFFHRRKHMRDALTKTDDGDAFSWRSIGFSGQQRGVQ